MKKNVSTALYFIVPGLLLTSWYAYARTKPRDELSQVPPPRTNPLPNLDNLIDHF